MTMPTRTTCRGCDGSRLEMIFDFGEVPLAGGFLAGPEAIATERRYPLRVHVCHDCALVQILDVVDPQILFTDYSFSSSTVPPLVDHFRKYAAWLVERFRPARWRSSGATMASCSSRCGSWASRRSAWTCRTTSLRWRATRGSTS